MKNFLTEDVKKKWEKVINAGEKINDSYRKNVTTILLENTQKVLKEAVMTGTSAVANYDPVLISMVRRAAPKLIPYDIAGVQPMTGPTGLVFAMKARYVDGEEGNMTDEVEALFDEANTAWSGKKGGDYDAAQDPSVMNVTSTKDQYTTGTFMPTADAEVLGIKAGSKIAEMGFSIEKVQCVAQSRALKATFSTELQQDLKAIHGLDADTELANILSTELLAEINRQFVRTVYIISKIGSQQAKIQEKGTFDMTVDSDGRWSAEQFKGLKMQLEREANVLVKETRRGRGNIVIASPDVVSALAESGRLDYAPALDTNIEVDTATTTYMGVLDGRFKVYSDPYLAGLTSDFFVVGYKGSSAYDAGLFYCPYVPLEMYRTVGQDDFQPRVGFKTRAGIVENPFAGKNLARHSNAYYRKTRVINL